MERKEGKEGVDLDQFLRLIALDVYNRLLNALCQLMHFLEELAIGYFVGLCRVLRQLHLCQIVKLRI